MARASPSDHFDDVPADLVAIFLSLSRRSLVSMVVGRGPRIVPLLANADEVDNRSSHLNKYSYMHRFSPLFIIGAARQAEWRQKFRFCWNDWTFCTA